MSGHSKWASIKHKKGAEDAKRGKIFTKIMREITAAARSGGGDPTGNPRLRAAIQAARAANMPKNNIENAVKKGTGELEGVSYEELTYEGYGPGGTAVLVDVMTDNKKRSAAEIRYLFSKNGGNMAEAGSVAWGFQKKGMIIIPKEGVDGDKVMEIALEAEAEDVKDVPEDKTYEVYTTPSSFEKVKEAFDKAGIKYSIAEVTMVPQNYIRLTGKDAEQMLKLMQALEDHDDVQKVYANFDITMEEMEALAG